MRSKHSKYNKEKGNNAILQQDMGHKKKSSQDVQETESLINSEFKKSKNEVLFEIAILATENNINIKEINTAITGLQASKNGTETFMRLFAYLGGIFIFSGLIIYIGTFWPSMNSVMKIAITLGTGIILYTLAIALPLQNKKNENMITPLFLTGTFFQTVGLFVAINEFKDGLDIRVASTLIFAVMLVQQILTFKSIKRASLIFILTSFWCLFFLSFLDLSHANEKATNIVVGMSLLCIAYLLDKSYYKSVANFWYLVGSVLFLSGLFDALKNTSVELLFFLISSFILYFCTVIRNRPLLFMSTLSTLGYIGYFTSKHFMDSTAWPILLIVLGAVCFGVGVLVLRISKKFT